MKWLVLAFCAVLTAGGVAFAADQPAAWHSEGSVQVTTQSVTFSNGDAQLHGTLFIPVFQHRVPALFVFHAASSPLASTMLYRHLSDSLPQMGIAVLLFDRRGTGASTGKADTAYQTLADDGIAGANALRQMPAIDASRIGYWGISQGGWLATLAASHDPRAAFAIAVSAPLVTPELQMEFAMSNRLRVLGYGQTDVDDMLAARLKLDGYFNGRNSRNDAVAALAKIAGKPWYDQMYLPKKPDAIATDPSKSTWRSELDIDSFGAVAQVKVPIFYILGGEDPWVPVAPTVARLRELTPTHPNLQYAVVPRANHLMMEVAHETMDDAKPEEVATNAPQSPAYFMLLAAWLEKTLSAPDAGSHAK